MEFVKDRTLRISGTLALWLPPILLTVLFLLFWAASLDPSSVVESRSKGLFPFPWLHLWFLYALLIIYLLVIFVQFVLDRSELAKNLHAPLSNVLTRFISLRLGVILLAVPVSCCLWSIPEWEPWMGVPAWASIDPPLSSLGIYLYSFVLGMALNRHRSLLIVLPRHVLSNCGIGFLSVAAFIGTADNLLEFAYVASARLKPLLAFFFGLALVSISLGIVGLGMRFFDQNRVWVRTTRVGQMMNGKQLESVIFSKD